MAGNQNASRAQAPVAVPQRDFYAMLRRALADMGISGGGGGGGVTDHGALTGLADDDHAQYHNNSRGDARYSLLAHNHAGTYDPTGTAAAAVASHEGAANPHPVYLTQAEADALYSLLAHVHANATGSVAGFMSAADKSKLDGVASGATANSADATLLARGNHTGTQAASTISDFAEAVDDRVGALLVQGSNITLTYNDAAGTLTISASGGGGADPWTWVKLASNSTVSTTAFANVSGMSFTALANTTYLVELAGAYQAAATTTGIALALDIPSGTVIGINQVATSATAAGAAEQIADATTTGATTGVRAANTNTPIVARWVVAIGATGGTVQLMQRSEVAASNTVLQAGLTIMGKRVI